MADEIVSVGIKIETTGADKAAASLDKVVAAGGKVDAAADKITAGAGKASKSLETLGATAATVAPQLDKAGSSGGKLGDLFKQATEGAGAFSGSLGLVKAGLVGAAAAFSVQSVIALGKAFLQTADAITNLNSQLKLATGSAAAAKEAYEGLFAVAQRSRVGFVELGNTYAQIARATDGLGLSSANSLRIVETLGKAITISGVSAGSASAAMIQLSQGLSSGTLRGEELNSILEQTPRVARAIADGLGVSIGQLRTMGSEGKLTAEAVSGALLKASATIDKEFGSVATTVSQAMTVMGNATTKAVGDFDSIVGVSSAVATGILSIVDAAGQLKDMFSGSWTGQAVAALAAMRQKVTENRDNPTLDMLRVQLENATQRAAAGGGSGFGLDQQKAAAQKEVARLQERIRKLETDEWDKAAKQISDSADKMLMDYNRVKEAGDKFIADKDNQTKAQQKESAFAKLRTEFAAATRDLKEGSAEYLRVYAAFLTGKDNIAKNFADKEKVDRSGASKAKADAEAYAVALAAGEKQLALLQAEIEARRPLTVVEKLSIELKEKEEELVRKSGSSRIAEVKAMNEQIIAQATLIQQERERIAAFAAMAASDAALQTQREQERGRLIDEADSVAAQTRALKAETEQIGLTSTQIAQLTIKRGDELILIKQAEEINARSAGRASDADAIARQVLELERLNQARRENLDVRLKTDAADRSKSALASSISEAAKAADDIGRAITDSLFRAAEAGKGFFESLRNSLKGMFNNLVLQPSLKLAYSSITSGAGGGGINSLAAAGQSFNGGFNSLFNSAAMSGIGERLGLSYNPLGEAGATSLTSLGQGIQTALPFLASIAQAAQGNYGQAALSAIGTAIAGPLGTVIGTVLGSFLNTERGGPKGGGSFSTTGERLFTPNTADAIATQIGDSLNTSIGRMLTNFGASSSRLQFGIGFDQDPQGKADNRVASFLRDANGNSILDNTAGRNVGRDDAVLQTELTTETKRLMLAALQAVGPTLEDGFGEIFARLDPATAAPEAIDNLFTLAQTLKALGDAAERLPGVMGTIADISAVAREELIGLTGGLDSLTSGLQTYYREFFTADEQLANAGANLATDFAKIGLSFDALQADSDGPRQAFRDLFEGLDLTTVGGRQSAAALLALAPAVDSWIDSIDAAREAAREAASQSAASIDNAFLSESDRFFQTFERLGLAIPRTTAEFQDLVRAQDTTTEQGRTLIATLLAVYGGFQAVDQAARDATDAIIRQALESSRSTVTAEMDALTRANGDLSLTLFELENPIRTTADQFLELGRSMQDTIDRMAQILGTGALSLLDQLQAAVNTRTAIAGARVGLAGTIQDQQVQGFSNRRDFRGGISFLKGIENALFAELQTTTDPAGVAGKITQALTTRYQFEAQLITEADDLRRTSLEKEINRLESLIDIADRLRDTITDLQTGSLSALAPAAQVSVAATSFGSVLNRAQAGDVKALQALPGEATRFLTESQSFNASGGDYASVFTSVIDSLNSVGVSLADAPTQLSLAQSQLTATGTVVDNTGAMVVDLRRLDTALEARSTRESDAITALVTAIRDQIAADERTREGIAIERNLQANRWSGLATTLESIDTSMNTLANNATLEGAR